MKVVVLGAGGMGRYAAQTAAALDFVEELVVGDLDGGAADDIAARLGPKASGAAVDVQNDRAMSKLFAGATAVLNTVGPFFRLGPPVLRAAITAGVHYLDINDDWESTEAMLALDDDARSAGVTAVIGVGASPGISNMLACLAMRELDDVDEVIAGFDLDAAMPEQRGDKPCAATVHALHQLSGRIRVFEDGAFAEAKPQCRVEFDYPGLGPRTGWTMGHPEAVTFPRTIKRTKVPATADTLKAELSALGVRSGMVLFVHSSLSALGWICGGAVAVIQALQEIVGPEGSLVIPSYSGGLTDPKNWQHPPVPEGWKDTIRKKTPAFDPLRTPTRGMGVIAETFRTWPGVVRSHHPHCSFAAWGADAQKIVANHQLENGLGEGSPLARIYDLGGWVLLLGVGFTNNTSMHLAEHRASYPGKAYEINGAPMMMDGRRQWVSVRDLEVDSDDFLAIGEHFIAETKAVQMGKVGAGTALLMPQRPLVDHTVEWMEAHRKASREVAEDF